MRKTKLLSILVLLMMAVSGAWATDPTVYNSGEVDLRDLKVGDILMAGVSLKKSHYLDGVSMRSYRFSQGGQIISVGTSFTIYPVVIGANGVINNKASGQTTTTDYTPITEGGEVGNAWEVSYIDAPSYADMKTPELVGIKVAPDGVTLIDGQGITELDSWKGQSCAVTYVRSFTAGTASTVCLPFAYTKKAADGSFYAFTNIEKKGSDYVATMTEPGLSTLEANTPYLYMPNATGDFSFSGTYTIPDELTAGSTTSGDWTFLGTYETIEWTTAPTGIYGFSAQTVGDISQGQFVKVGDYVRIVPMRCYLKYKGGNEDYAGARTSNGANDEVLPETIKVRLISANGEVTAIGSLSTKTGEVTLDSDAWYSLDGRRIQNPTKGVYIKNGRKVVIK